MNGQGKNAQGTGILFPNNFAVLRRTSTGWLQLGSHHVIPKVTCLSRFCSTFKTLKAKHDCHLFFPLIIISGNSYVVRNFSSSLYLSQYQMVIIIISMQQKTIVGCPVSLSREQHKVCRTDGQVLPLILKRMYVRINGPNLLPFIFQQPDRSFLSPYAISCR